MSYEKLNDAPGAICVPGCGRRIVPEPASARAVSSARAARRAEEEVGFMVSVWEVTEFWKDFQECVRAQREDLYISTRNLKGRRRERTGGKVREHTNARGKESQ